jgi:hypothetical protein
MHHTRFVVRHTVYVQFAPVCQHCMQMLGWQDEQSRLMLIYCSMGADSGGAFGRVRGLVTSAGPWLPYAEAAKTWIIAAGQSALLLADTTHLCKHLII